MLCRRCEYRVKFYEEGHAPRFECGDVKNSVSGCYMYKPVMPCVLTVDEGDDRQPFGPGMISARMHFVRVADGEAVYKDAGDGLIPYYREVK